MGEGGYAHFRKSKSAQDRVVVIVCYLVTDVNYNSLQFPFRTSEQAICKIITGFFPLCCSTRDGAIPQNWFVVVVFLYK